MESIVTLSGGMPVVSSTAIAEGVGHSHKNVIRLVRDNRSDMEEFGRVRFENGSLADFVGKEVTLTFEMKDARLYAFAFR